MSNVHDLFLIFGLRNFTSLFNFYIKTNDPLLLQGVLGRGEKVV